MAAGTVPLRITHNDTKINNVLFHADRDEGLCVIDLDTLMPGSSLYDFGDLVRTATATAAEDETDLAKVDSDPTYYQALHDGWLAELGGTLTAEERKLLPVGGALMTYEVGVRFLTDHLDGDKYFKIKRPGHNLDRARNQIAMAQAILRRHLR
ncbi:MAG: aminoglycoside phosphotransferase family protein, partial [Planctomycetes bacterium]|nr:aminoglycoside phosphotransferase family protein [Planctomycetota bacterium]